MLAIPVTPEASEAVDRLLGEAMSAAGPGSADFVRDGRNGRGDNRSGGENLPLKLDSEKDSSRRAR